MNQSKDKKKKNFQYSILIKVIALFLLELTAINCQQACDKTSDVLECYFCSNTKKSKECSDGGGNPLMNQWTVLKSSPGQDTSDLRYQGIKMIMAIKVLFEIYFCSIEITKSFNF